MCLNFNLHSLSLSLLIILLFAFQLLISVSTFFLFFSTLQFFKLFKHINLKSIIGSEKPTDTVKVMLSLVYAQCFPQNRPHIVTANGKQCNVSPHNQTPPIKCIHIHNAPSWPKEWLEEKVGVVDITPVCVSRRNHGSDVYQTIFSKPDVAMCSKRNHHRKVLCLTQFTPSLWRAQNLRIFTSAVFNTMRINLLFVRSSNSA